MKVITLHFTTKKVHRVLLSQNLLRMYLHPIYYFILESLELSMQRLLKFDRIILCGIEPQLIKLELIVYLAELKVLKKQLQ